jgi:sensor c-di-GMP phosphodiesterase-like protein
MTMANPYLPPEIPPDADLPEAQHGVMPVERQTGLWLPLAIAIAIVIGLGYYYYGQSTISPSMRAADAAKSQPSPN